MARRRVNKQLLVILVGGFIVLLGFMWGYWQGRLRTRDPQVYMVKGDELLEQKKYKRAVARYGQATKWAGKRGDTATEVLALVKASEAFPHVETENAIGRALGKLTQAVTKDPNSVLARKARMNFFYELVRDGGHLQSWQRLQQYADDLVEVVSQHPDEEVLDEKGRAHYIRGLATLRVVELRRDPPAEALEARREALEFFIKASEYTPNDVDYCRALVTTHLSIARQLSIMRSPLPKEDRQLAIEQWEMGLNALKEFQKHNPNSGASWVLWTNVQSYVQAWVNSDLRDEVDQDDQLGTGLTDEELVNLYLKTWRDDSVRPSLSETSEALDRLTAEYLQEAQKLDTDIVAVQSSLAVYWRAASRRDVEKVIASLDKAAANESDIISKMGLYLQIAQTYKQDGQTKQALKVAEDAAETPVDLKIIRTGALRMRIYLLHQFCAQTLVELTVQIKGTDESAIKEFNSLLDQAEVHLDESLAIAGTQGIRYSTLIIRGQIAQQRRPRTREHILEAISFYEQARDEMENMGIDTSRRGVLQYANLHVNLARAYSLTTQHGEAEAALSKGIDRLHSIGAGDNINPPIQVLLAEMQLSNRHVAQAEQTLTRVIRKLSDEPLSSDEEQARLMGKALELRVRQYELQDQLDKAMTTLEYVEKHYPQNAEWSLRQQVRLLGIKPNAPITERQAVLQRWITLRPESAAPVALLAELYLRQEQPDKAEALVTRTIAANPQLAEILNQVIATIKQPDRAKIQQMRIDRLMKDDVDPLQRQIGLFQLHREDYSYFSVQAANYKNEGKTVQAQQAEQQASKSNDQAIQALKRGYEIDAHNSRIHESLLFHYIKQKDWANAQKIVDRAEQENWDGVSGLYFRGRLANSKGEDLKLQDPKAAQAEYQTALTYLEEAVQRRPTFFQAWAERARSEALMGRHNDAMNSAQKAAQQNPTSHVAVRVLLEITRNAWLRAKAADNPVSTEKLAKDVYDLAERALALDPNYTRAATFKMAYLDEYDPERAAKERSALLLKDPSNRANLQRLLTIYQQQGKTAQAIEILEELAAKEPDAVELVLVLANSYNQLKQYEQALARLLPASQRWPEQLNVAAMLASTYQRKGEPDKARASLQAFLIRSKEEDQANVYRFLGTLETQLGRHDRAIAAFQQAISRIKKYHPQEMAMLTDLARLMFNSGARPEAIRTLLPLAEEDDPYAIRMLVELYRRNGESAESIKWAKRALAQSPESAQLKMILAGAFLAGGEPDQAQGLLEEAIEQLQNDPKAADAYIMLSGAYSMQQEYKTAIRRLEEGIQSGVNHPNMRMELANRYIFEGRTDAAAAEYRKVLNKYPNNKRVRHALATMWIRLGRYAQAESTLEKGRETQPEEYVWSEQLSSLWLRRTDKPRQQRHDEALRHAQDAMNKADKSVASVASVMAVLNIRGEYARCVEFYEQVTEDQKHSYRVLMALAAAEYGRWRQAKSPSEDGRSAMSKQDLDRLARRATALYLQALAKSGDDTSSYLTVMRGLVALHSLDEVIEATQMRTNANTQDIHNRVLLAMLLNTRANQRIGTNQTSAANADLNRAAGLLQALAARRDIAPAVRVAVYQQLAGAYTNMGMEDRCIELYEKVLTLRPNDVAVLNNLSYILANNYNRPKEALKYVERALQHRPGEPNLLDTYGWALFKDGQTGRAIDELQRSVGIQPSPITYYHLGVALEQSGEKQRALQALREAEQLLKSNPTGKEDIRQKINSLIEKVKKE